MRTRLGLVGMLVLVSVVGAGAPPAAWSRSDPTCTFSATLTLEPALTSLPSWGQFRTDQGDEGSYQCRGAFGYESSGRATGSGDYGSPSSPDSCTDGGEGNGTLQLSDRRTSQKAHFTFMYSPFSDDGIHPATAMGQFSGDRFEGTFTLTALEHSNCVSGVTKVLLEGKGWLTR
jgi:hypothetical protein